MKTLNLPKKSSLGLLFASVMTIFTLVSCTAGRGFELLETENYSNRELDHAIGMTALESVGDQKILVVPVVFSNTIGQATPEVHTMINKLFFGKSEDTGWESVASFYEKSSYGKLKITGEVRPYFQLDLSTRDVANLPISVNQDYGEGFYWDQTHHIIERIYNTLDASLLREYDQDGDGHVDALWMVYIANIQAVGGGDDDPFWAYKFYWNREPNEVKPTPNVYAWASYNFAREGRGYTFDKPDAHTFIHETGHVLGLPDYYDYDGKTAPVGQIDMMDYNIIDHNMYSKFRLNWSKPLVLKDNVKSGKITLKPAESSGDFILLKNGWNGHAYDEYILIEYYTPTGLNEQDSTGSGYYSNRNSTSTLGYTEPGVRMWHVDSRLRTYEYNNKDQLIRSEWSDEIEYDDFTYTAIGPSNTGSRSIDESYKLLHLMDAQGSTSKTGNWLRSPSKAGNPALFKSGTTIDAADWAKYLQTRDDNNKLINQFNDGSEVGFTVTIGKMTAEGVEITIKRA